MMVSNQNSYLKEVRESQKVFSALVNAMEKSHKAVVAEIEDRQKEEESRVETLVKELEEEIQELRKETTESDAQISVNGDQSDDTKQVTVVSPLCCKLCNDSGGAVTRWNVFFLCHAEHCFSHVSLQDEGLVQGYYRNWPLCWGHQASIVRHNGKDEGRNQKALQMWWAKQYISFIHIRIPW